MRILIRAVIHIFLEIGMPGYNYECFIGINRCNCNFYYKEKGKKKFLNEEGKEWLYGIYNYKGDCFA